MYVRVAPSGAISFRLRAPRQSHSAVRKPRGWRGRIWMATISSHGSALWRVLPISLRSYRGRITSSTSYRTPFFRGRPAGLRETSAPKLRETICSASSRVFVQGPQCPAGRPRDNEARQPPVRPADERLRGFRRLTACTGSRPLARDHTDLRRGVFLRR